MKKLLFAFTVSLILFFCFTSESCNTPTSAEKEHQAQEQILNDIQSSVGMPAIKNFREKRLLKMIFELRDQSTYVTYSYLFSNYSGKYIYIGQTIGYPIPYATQYTNPQQMVGRYTSAVTTIGQADPNGLFSPASAAGTWVMVVNPQGKAVPAYFEPDVVCLPYKLPAYALVYAPPGY